MNTQTKDLWSLVRGRPQIDPTELAEAVRDQAAQQTLDDRTRWLIHDSLNALKSHWGDDRLKAWLGTCSARDAIETIWREEFERIGFPSLGSRIMEKTDPEEIRQYLRELGLEVHKTIKLNLGGSAALILPGYLSRNTDDLDVVDEVPSELRTLYQLLNRLEKDYGLHLAHFQSHYLPKGWEQRVHSLGSFGKIQVFLVDVYVVFLSKLFSGRGKDRNDLRMLVPQLDKDTLVRRFRDTTASLNSDAKFHDHAVNNWYILYGEALPS